MWGRGRQPTCLGATQEVPAQPHAGHHVTDTAHIGQSFSQGPARAALGRQVVELVPQGPTLGGGQLEGDRIALWGRLDRLRTLTLQVPRGRVISFGR